MLIASGLQVTRFEDALRDGLDDGHDGPPEPRYIGDVLAFANGANDAGGDCLRSREEAVARNVRRHGRGDETRLDSEHMHAFAVAAVAQASQKRIERGLRGAVDVVALAAA